MKKLKVTFKWKDDEGIPCSCDCYVYHIPRIGETVDLDYHSGRVKDVIHDISPLWDTHSITIELGN